MLFIYFTSGPLFYFRSPVLFFRPFICLFSFISELDRAVSQLVRGGITTNTRATYSAAIKKYSIFCRIYALQPLPVTGSNAIRFVAYCASQALSVSTVRVYLAGLRSWSIDLGLPPPDLYTPQMIQAIRCMDRHYTPARAPPILYQHLLSFYFRAHFSRDNLMSITAMSLAFFACLRPAEYLLTRGTTRPPTRKDVQFSQDFSSLDFTVTSSKTNPKGFTVHLGCSQSAVCAVCLLRALFQRFPAPPTSFLFLTPSNTPMSYTYLTNKMHALLSLVGVHPAPYTLHSLRAGAATTAAATGCSEDQIQKLGRWSSDCYRRYIRPSKKEQAALAPRLATSLH